MEFQELTQQFSTLVCILSPVLTRMLLVYLREKKSHKDYSIEGFSFLHLIICALELLQHP